MKIPDRRIGYLSSGRGTVPHIADWRRPARPVSLCGKVFLGELAPDDGTLRLCAFCVRDLISSHEGGWFYPAAGYETPAIEESMTDSEVQRALDRAEQRMADNLVSRLERHRIIPAEEAPFSLAAARKKVEFGRSAQEWVDSLSRAEVLMWHQVLDYAAPRFNAAF